MSLINLNPTVFTYPQQEDYSNLRPLVNPLQCFLRHLNKSPIEVTILAISPTKRASDFVIPQINKVLNSCLILLNFPNWKSDISSSQTRFTVSFKGQFCPRGLKKSYLFKEKWRTMKNRCLASSFICQSSSDFNEACRDMLTNGWKEGENLELVRLENGSQNLHNRSNLLKRKSQGQDESRSGSRSVMSRSRCCCAPYTEPAEALAASGAKGKHLTLSKRK